MNFPWTAAVSALLICGCLSACKPKTQAENYSYTTEVQKASIMREANDRGIPPDEWLRLVDVCHQLSQQHKEAPPADLWEVILRGAASPHALLRQMAFGAFSGALTPEQRQEANNILVRTATSDPDSSVRTGALLQLYRSDNPKWRDLVRAELRKPGLPEANRKISEDMLKGLVRKRRSAETGN